MKLVNRKTQKAIQKSVKKVIKKHGPKIAAGLVGSVASALTTLASTEAARSRGKRSNLADLSRQLAATIADDKGKKSRKGGRDKVSKKKRQRDETADLEAERMSG
jgi:hypothetical protein